MKNYTDVLLEEYDMPLDEAKADQQKFIDKFGQERFDRFNKLKAKLKNVKDDSDKPATTDILYYVKNADEKMLDTLLDRAEGRQYTAGVTTKYDIEGKPIPMPANTKKLMASNEYYDVYKVTDYTDAIDLATKKIPGSDKAYGYWCIAGRYEPEDDNTVKVSQAKQYFNEYLGNQYSAYYFCIPKKNAKLKMVMCALKEATRSESYELWGAEDDFGADDVDLNQIPWFKDNAVGFEFKYDEEENARQLKIKMFIRKIKKWGFTYHNTPVTLNGKEYDLLDITSRSAGMILTRLKQGVNIFAKVKDAFDFDCKLVFKDINETIPSIPANKALLQIFNHINSCTTIEQLNNVSLDLITNNEVFVAVKAFSAPAENINEDRCGADDDNDYALIIRTMMIAKYFDVDRAAFRQDLDALLAQCDTEPASAVNDTTGE